MQKHATLLAVILILLTGCANMHCPFAPKPAQVNHVVLCWLKEPGNEAQRQQLVDASYTLKKIPGVVTLTAGRPIPSTRPVVDSSWDVAIVMSFTNEQALNDYLVNPIHKKAVSDVLKPLTAKMLIYDVKRGEVSK